jgi:hypothetical protein
VIWVPGTEPFAMAWVPLRISTSTLSGLLPFCGQPVPITVTVPPAGTELGKTVGAFNVGTGRAMLAGAAHTPSAPKLTATVSDRIHRRPRLPIRPPLFRLRIYLSRRIGK